MGKELAEAHREAWNVFEAVQEATGENLKELCWERSEEVLRATENAQLALFTCGVAAWKVLEARSPGLVTAVAGHSVGEYAALVASGALDLQDGARLVQLRGRVMGKAGAGTMAAVLGLERDALQAVCEQAGGTVVIANDNCPGQLVISGEHAAVGKAGELAAAAGAKRVMPLNVSGAFHSPLMREASGELGAAAALVRFNSPAMPIYSNVTAKPEQAAWPELLEKQLLSPVRWTESVQNMIADGVTGFIECGGGNVLSGLVGRIDKSVATYRVADEESLGQVPAA